MVNAVKYLTLHEASVYLEKHAKDSRKANMWFGYLKHNSRKFMDQDGYKVISHVIDGELHYTEASLKAFIKVLGSRTDRKEIELILSAVDEPKTKKSNKPKSNVKDPKKATKKFKRVRKGA